jgi:transposase
MVREKRTTFPKSFKREAVRLLEHSGRPAAEIARELGIRRNQLYKWQEQMRARGEDSFPGSGRPSEESEQLRRLKRENAQLREERDILKKAAAYFAKELG